MKYKGYATTHVGWLNLYKNVFFMKSDGIMDSTAMLQGLQWERLGNYNYLDMCWRRVS